MIGRHTGSKTRRDHESDYEVKSGPSPPALRTCLKVFCFLGKTFFCKPQKNLHKPQPEKHQACIRRKNFGHFLYILYSKGQEALCYGPKNRKRRDRQKYRSSYKFPVEINGRKKKSSIFRNAELNLKLAFILDILVSSMEQNDALIFFPKQIEPLWILQTLLCIEKDA